MAAVKVLVTMPTPPSVREVTFNALVTLGVPPDTAMRTHAFALPCVMYFAGTLMPLGSVSSMEAVRSLLMRGYRAWRCYFPTYQKRRGCCCALQSGGKSWRAPRR